jgi:hypothetical protein
MGDKVYEFLSSYFPQTAALFIAVGVIYLLLPSLSGSLTYFFKLFFRRPKRKLLWRVFHRTQLPEVSDHKLSVLLDGQSITGVGVVILDVNSAGEESVSPEHVDRGMIALTFGGAQVEACVPLNKSPKDLDVTPVADGNTLQLRVGFLNRGETAKFEVVLSNFDEKRDIIRPVGRLKDGIIKLVEWDRPGLVENWGTAFSSSFTLLLSLFLLLTVTGFQLFYADSHSFVRQSLWAVAFAFVVAGTHCWIATGAQRAEEEERAVSLSHSGLRQVWVPIHIYLRWLFTNKFYLKMLVVSAIFGIMPYVMSWLSVFGKRVVEAMR